MPLLQFRSVGLTLHGALSQPAGVFLLAAKYVSDSEDREFILESSQWSYSVESVSHWVVYNALLQVLYTQYRVRVHLHAHCSIRVLLTH